MCFLARIGHETAQALYDGGAGGFSALVMGAENGRKFPAQRRGVEIGRIG